MFCSVSLFRVSRERFFMPKADPPLADKPVLTDLKVCPYHNHPKMERPACGGAFFS
jgi:hypothetical protein